MNKINEVLLVGGTHGNELSGIYIQKLIRDKLFPVERQTFQVRTLLANPAAIERNVRFIDTDLNRLFSEFSSDMTDAGAEGEIALSLKERFGSEKNRLIIDLHNTTSNMGATLILLARNSFYERMGAYVKHRMPEANILFESGKHWSEQPYLCTMGQAGIMLEIAEQSHGVLTPASLDTMKQLLSIVLDYIEMANISTETEFASYEAYEFKKEIPFPLDEQGMRLATVHPTLCGRDFSELSPGEPLLATFAGPDFYWQGKQSVFPHFINEAAYSSQHIAMVLAEKVKVSPD